LFAGEGMKSFLIAAVLLMSAALVVAQDAKTSESATAAMGVAGTSRADQGTATASTASGSSAAEAGQAVSANPGASPIAPAPSAPSPSIEPSSTAEPHTEMLDTSTGSSDPLLEPKPLPRADLSLVGGLARKVDTVHNRLTLEPFGGGPKYVIYFDERTRILSAGRETTALAIHPGDRVYVDTQALGSQVFARTIQVRSQVGPARANGQIIEVLGGVVKLQDRLSGTTIRFTISDRTKVEEHGKPALAADLHSGSLVDVTFTPSGRRGEAQNITIVASPGETYAFAGVLTHVDVRDGVLALDNDVDGANYELFFDPLGEKNLARLTVGTPVYITGSFDGKRYRATSIKVNTVAASQP